MDSNSSAGNGTSSGLSDLFLLYSKNVFAVLYVLLFLLGMPGNGLLLWILLRGLQRKSGSHISRLTEPLFLNIVILDLLFLLYNAPVMFGNILFRDWRLGRLLCVTNRSFSLWVSFAAFYSMLAIALLRYMAILHPMRVMPISQKQIAIACGLIWVTCLIFSAPLWINYEIIHVEGQTYCVNQMAWKEINLYLRLLGGVGFLPPTLLMIFCYLRIICTLKVRRALSMHTASSLQVNWRASLMALVTMVTLVAMWLPYWLVIFFIKEDELLTTAPMYLAYHLTSLLAFANRCINPMICFCLSFQFQARLRNLFRRVGKGICQVGPIHLG
ncbi:C3a anaphylatoxin chemotactic receptor-like [Zootoca vivipara]|uniref:C3a anaphylatoxin chemotactic receptor-like n=1 Tax=Zootoca vivipara TaxID=8524 RepID=UPI00293B928B|nr:C3a anaphylatoxin chemotactic receptor-like [Zootoca vivipara]